MANTNVVSAAKPGASGAIYVAPTGTTLPTTASATLGSTFTELGYVSEDGVTNDFSPESENIKAWGGTVVLTAQKGREDKFKFKLLGALDENVQKLVYGDSNVTGSLSTGMTIKANQDALVAHAYVFDMAVKGGIKRIVVPNGCISSVGTITYADAQAIAYELEITALPDANGVNHYDYTTTATVGE